MIGSMTVTELKQKLDQNEELVLIDVREQGEWDEAHIEAAQFLPLSNFQEEMKKLSDKGATIVCQCRSGKRSLNAAMMLQDEGFENLYNLEGGILAWVEAGFPTKA
ncbi:MAG: rhodanese-like domain-containing protein [Bdellovibrionota bacterium]|nr:rhodanese-like domain-containing protein [Bdellovibrionota bacterium]